MSEIAIFARRCRLFAGLIRLLAVGLAMLLVPWLAALPFAPDGAGHGAAAAMLLWRVPPLCYLAALWFLSGAIRSIGAAHPFRVRTMVALQRAGAALIFGGLFSLIGVTNVVRLIGGGGSYAHFDVAGLTLACVGASLFLFARLFGQARDMEEELEGMI